eukprot:Nitzschia sp. Nitz4//scaffold55_size114948//103249//106599//NITZ4_003925-RA/size114948-snap-gene-0.180-mRNA-1//1//CDS//3329554602//1475//frame0
MNTTGRDSNFRSQTEAETICKSGRAVLEYTSSVHTLQELLANLTFLTADNGFGVSTSVLVNPINGHVDAVDNFNQTALQAEG